MVTHYKKENTTINNYIHIEKGNVNTTTNLYGTKKGKY